MLREDEQFMREALAEARAAAALGEVPIGAVVVCDGRVVARAHNRRELDDDPSAHAEFSAIVAASRALGRWRLSDCTVYVTLEPCLMCAGLMVNARVGRCVYGAADAKAGALGSLYHLGSDTRLNHSFEVTPGVLGEECSALLSGFFKGLREGRNEALAGNAAHGRAWENFIPAGPALAEEPALHAPTPRVLLAVDSFKGSATSGQAEDWIAEGVLRACPQAQVEKLPIADGGEGVVDALRASMGGEFYETEVCGPLGQRVRARYLFGGADDTSADPWAVIETAEAAGIRYSPCTHEAALRASSFGAGELVLDAVRRGAKHVYLGLGGSATVDGGLGLLSALGATIALRTPNDDESIEATGGLSLLRRVESIDIAPALEAFDGAELHILSDVTNPLVGEKGAVKVFGPQKGLAACSKEELDAYDRGMRAFGHLLDKAVDAAARCGACSPPRFRSLLGVPGAGAAGGMGAALLALGAHMESGIETVLNLANFDERVRDVDLVITGEGAMDSQTADGKAPAGVAVRAKKLGVPVIALTGSRADDLKSVYAAGIDLVLPICRKPMGLQEALEPEAAHANLAAAGESAMRAYLLKQL